jgi:hypothetical protein
MALMDELEGIFGAEAIAKLPAEKRADLEFNEELRKYYDGQIDTAPVRQPARAPVATTTPATTTETTASTTGLSAGLDDIARLLDSRIGNLDERISTAIATAIKPEGDKLFNNSVARSVELSRELQRIDREHHDLTGEQFDDAKLNTFITEQGGFTKFGSVRAAYDAFIAPVKQQKAIDTGIREGLKQRNSGASLPGVTPNGSKGPVSILTARRRDGSTADGGVKTAVQKAAEDLDRRMFAVNE